MSMEDRIQLLPLWRLSNPYPAFYDTESGSTIEQTGKVYEAMRQLQADYNKFAREVNQVITDFVTGIEKDQTCFEQRMTKTIHDYIAMIDMKIAEQDKAIDEAIAYMKDNLSQSITEIVSQMKELGEIDEAVLNAIDGIGTRVSNLEKINTSLNERVETLEVSRTYLSYDSNNKEVKLIINERVGE